MVIQGDYAISGANYLNVRYTNTNPYADGDQASYDPTTWTHNAGNDIYFVVYVEENNTSVTMPAEYTGKCLLGYIYNNSGGDLIGIDQIDREVRYVTNEDGFKWGTQASAIPTLGDFTTLLPPIPVVAHGGLGNASASNHHQIAGVPEGYQEDIAGLHTFKCTPMMNALTGAVTAPVATGIGVLTETQALYLNVNAGTMHFWILGYRW